MLARIKLPSCILALLAITVVAACADKDTAETTAAGKTWQVARVSGVTEVRPTPDAAWQPLVGTLLIPGADVKVASEGLLQLASAGDIVTAGPGSLFTLPAATAGADGVIQSYGQMRYEVETRPAGRFQVETPYLAITVKETEFVVDVGSDGASVEVDEGIVQVDSYESGQSTDLTAGQSARLDRAVGSLLKRATAPGAAFEPVATPTGNATPRGRPFTDAVAPGNSAFGHFRGLHLGQAKQAAKGNWNGGGNNK